MTVLRKLHDELDSTVAKANGWSLICPAKKSHPHCGPYSWACGRREKGFICGRARNIKQINEGTHNDAGIGCMGLYDRVENLFIPNVGEAVAKKSLMLRKCGYKKLL